MTTLGIELTTFRLVEQCLNQLRVSISTTTNFHFILIQFQGCNRLGEPYVLGAT
jgi:hypothetical protein